MAGGRRAVPMPRRPWPRQSFPAEADHAVLGLPTPAANCVTGGQSRQPSHRIDAQFPEQFVDRLSRQEVFNKHLFRPNTYLHKWWARRCGSTFRTILKQFAPSAELADYYAAGGLEGLTVLDPMMGGGTTLHEAIRLGANVVGADIDPIPVLQARSSLSRIPLPALRTAFDRFLGDLHADLRPYFLTHCPTCAAETDVRYSLYGLRKRCGCGTVIQVEQFDLRQEGKTTIRLDPSSGEILSDSQPSQPAPAAGCPRKLIKKGDKEVPRLRSSLPRLPRRTVLRSVRPRGSRRQVRATRPFLQGAERTRLRSCCRGGPNAKRPRLRADGGFSRSRRAQVRRSNPPHPTWMSSRPGSFSICTQR